MRTHEVQVNVRRFTEQISVKDIAGIIIGSFIVAVGIQGVLIPAGMLTGGITGIAIILNYISRVDVGVWYILLNIPVFFAGYKYVSRRFVVYSIIGTVALSFFLAVLKPLNFKIDDMLLSALAGGALVGTGGGIIFRSKGSTGGLDIVAIIIRRFWGYNLGQTFFLSNLFILGVFVYISNIELALFSALSIFVNSRIVDTVSTGPEITRTALIISEYYIDIAETILHNLHRGCTYLQATGAYSHESKTMVLVTVGKTQLPRLKEIVFHYDPQAFIIVNETVEVFGRGFQKATDL